MRMSPAATREAATSQPPIRAAGTLSSGSRMTCTQETAKRDWSRVAEKRTASGNAANRSAMARFLTLASYPASDVSGLSQSSIAIQDLESVPGASQR
jgi:hypothetical protein